MKQFLIIAFLICISSISSNAQETFVKATIVKTDGVTPLENVNIVNLNLVKGTATDSLGAFEIRANVNDTLHLSYLGYKSIKVRVTNDWIKYKSSAATKIQLTELALALEEVVVNELRLTGFLALDIQQVPLNKNVRYSISGLPSTGYEGGRSSKNALTRTLGAIFNPVDFLHNVFGKKPRELRRLRDFKKDDELRNLLATRFDREMLTALLKIDKVDLDLLASECDYSKDFINTANDLQMLDAISECYEEYKVLNRSRTSKL
ncbi:carboxypeptidase-like regulatory domain-containing protein [Flavobacteriaceae bacterium AU392]|nr:carboxypeptidase-like regulatory domain-containing protein [Flavobacteriaceae bacterium]RKM83508.1 carboxypeptidase-like regulatory domain-containing protein [Flavobacteriaceae bacterium AU392]